MAITFDPINKRIILDSASVTAEIIFSRWEDWMAQGDNAKYLPAFSHVGGNELGSGLLIPNYFFLLNGWRVRPMESNHSLIITGNLFVDGGGVPVVNTLGDYNVSVQYTVPVQAQGISTSGSSGPSAETIALAVWNLLKSTPFNAGSMGEHVNSLGNSASNTSYYELATTIVRTVGSDQGGTVANIQSHDETLFSTGEVVGSGLEVLVTFNDLELHNPQRCTIVGRYVGSAGHTINIQAFNYISGQFENRGVMLNRTTNFDYSIPLSDDHISGTGDIQIRFLHSTGAYVSSHRLHIDFMQVELIDTNSTLISDVNSIKSKTDQMEFTLGRIHANAQMISDSITAADNVETNIQNLDVKSSAIKKLVVSGL